MTFCLRMTTEEVLRQCRFSEQYVIVDIVAAYDTVMNEVFKRNFDWPLFHVTVRSWAMPVKSLPEDSIVHTVVNRVLTGCIFSIRVSTTDDENIANARWCNQVGNIACRWSGGGRKQHACFLVASSTDSSQLSFYVAPRRHLIWQRVRKRPEYFTWNASALRVCWWHMRSISNEKIIIWVHGGLIGFLFIEGDFGRRGCRFLWDVRFAWMIISFFFLKKTVLFLYLSIPNRFPHILNQLDLFMMR